MPSPDSIHANLAQGRSALASGQPGEARDLFTQALEAAQQRNAPAQETDARIALAESERGLGDLPAARAQLQAALALNESSAPDPARSAALEIALGGVALAQGRAEDAQARLEAGARGADEAGRNDLAAAALMDLGTLLALQGQGEEALERYRQSEQSAQAAGDDLAAAKALANAARVDANDPERSRSLLERGQTLAQKLPGSAVKANLLIGLAQREIALAAEWPGAQAALRANAANLLLEALAAADAVGDPRTASYALGFLGGVYEEAGRPGEALAMTRRAAMRAARGDAPEALYRWQAQSGRLLAAEGKITEATTAYQHAVDHLQSLRHRQAWGGDLGVSSFETAILPVYYALVDLLLRQAASEPVGDARQALLRRARDTVEELRAAELRDYFQDDCVDAQRAKLAALESVSASALVIYPVPLSDRLVILVGLPSGRLEQYSVPVGRTEVEREAHSLRRRLQERTNRRYLAHARTLYDWLLRPLEHRLDSGEFETLVFVPDGALLTIPMATLHDGEKFLIERFALALTPGMELTDPRAMDPDNLRALLAGMSEGSEGFSPLPNVVAEIDAIRAMTPSDVLLNADFRRETLHRELSGEPFGLVHLATHAQFSGTAGGAFLQAWDGPIGINELAADIELFRFRDAPLELLTLSACETAQGDDRAALGLSGIAIQSGARSAVGTLWSVNDPAAASLINAFYHAMLVGGESRAQALRGAQQELLAQRQYRHPVYWAPFILIGSWL